MACRGPPGPGVVRSRGQARRPGRFVVDAGHETVAELKNRPGSAAWPGRFWPVFGRFLSLWPDPLSLLYIYISAIYHLSIYVCVYIYLLYTTGGLSHTHAHTHTDALLSESVCVGGGDGSLLYVYIYI